MTVTPFRSRRPRMDREEVLASIVLLGSIPLSVALLGALVQAFSGLGTFALVAPFIPPFAAALTVGERAFPTELKREIVKQTFIAAFCTFAAFLACQVLLAAPPARSVGLAGLVGLAVYVAGAVMV